MKVVCDETTFQKAVRFGFAEAVENARWFREKCRQYLQDKKSRQ